MHLLESASHRFECVPFVHEVGAGIAADYFNESAPEGKKAFVLVTAGPALTNLVTAIASAWVDSRELLVIGGQAKVSDLSRGKRSEEHTSELQSLDHISYAVFCLRSEERRVGKECWITCRSRWSPYH